MIIVSGANGQLGRAIVERLLERVPAAEIGVSVREPEKAEALRGRGVRVRRGSFDDAASLAAAFEGASKVLLVSANSAFGAEAIEQHRTAIEAARAAGARRILYTSHMGSSATSLFPPMRQHAAVEAILQTCGVPFTSLRNGFYASSALLFAGHGLAAGTLALPADGPVSWTTHADLAEAAAIASTEEGRLDGLTAPLTASPAVDFAGVAALASELGGRPIERVIVDDESYRARMVSDGAPAARVEIAMGMFAASRAREFAAVDPTLEALLGRPPIAMRAVIAEHLAKR